MEKEQTFESSSWSKWASTVIFILVILIAVFLAYSNLQATPKVKAKPLPQKPIKDEQKHSLNSLSKLLKQKFPAQSSNFHINMLSSYERSIIENTDPSIVLLISDKKTAGNLNCVAETLISVLDTQSNTKTSIIRSNDFNTRDAEQVKLNLDLKLEKIFSIKRIALLENIEKLPASSMILFYTYGDDASTAKYRGIILMFTLELDLQLSNEERELYSTNVSKFSEFIENYLKKLWGSQIDFDQLLPLLARIANNLILINNEKNCQ